jgi:diguanylate cyclase (GGDEF)-like protein
MKERRRRPARRGDEAVPRQRQLQSATGQASLLFAIAGSLGLVTELLVRDRPQRAGAIAVNVVAVVAAVVIHRLPWERWSSKATLVLPVLALLLISVGGRLAPGAPTVYGVWFVVLYAWVGFWHPPRTATYLAPLGIVAYVAPFIGSASAPEDAIASVVVAIPAAVVLGEVLASNVDAMGRAQSSLEEAQALLERANLTDDLTGVGNRRRANSLLDSMRAGDGLVLLDLDHFKEVNDSLGHAEGDRVLSDLGDYLRSAVREADAVARFGGEEFLVLLRGAGGQVEDAARRLLDGWRVRCSTVTLSAGAAIHVDSRGPDATFRAADAALYEAKHRGRDRHAVEGPALMTALDHGGLVRFWSASTT